MNNRRIHRPPVRGKGAGGKVQPHNSGRRRVLEGLIHAGIFAAGAYAVYGPLSKLINGDEEKPTEPFRAKAGKILETPVPLGGIIATPFIPRDKIPEKGRYGDVVPKVAGRAWEGEKDVTSFMEEGVISIWHWSCRICRDELPALEEISKRYPVMGVLGFEDPPSEKEGKERSRMVGERENPEISRKEEWGYGDWSLYDTPIKLARTTFPNVCMHEGDITRLHATLNNEKPEETKLSYPINLIVAGGKAVYYTRGINDAESKRELLGAAAHFLGK